MQRIGHFDDLLLERFVEIVLNVHTVGTGVAYHGDGVGEERVQRGQVGIVDRALRALIVIAEVCGNGAGYRGVGAGRLVIGIIGFIGIHCGVGGLGVGGIVIGFNILLLAHALQAVVGTRFFIVIEKIASYGLGDRVILDLVIGAQVFFSRLFDLNARGRIIRFSAHKHGIGRLDIVIVVQRALSVS